MCCYVRSSVQLVNNNDGLRICYRVILCASFMSLLRAGLLNTCRLSLCSIVLIFKSSKNTKYAPLHWMITSKGKINELCLICHFFFFFFLSFFPAPSSPLSPFTSLFQLMEWWFGKYYEAQNWLSELHTTAWPWVFDGYPCSDCLSSVLYKESLSCAPFKSERLMLWSGYLATVGDQQLYNETLLQTSTWTCMFTSAMRHTHNHTTVPWPISFFFPLNCQIWRWQ